MTIPIDLQISVAIRLPIKSIVQSKTVSRKWQEMLSCNETGKEHYKFMLDNKEHNTKIYWEEDLGDFKRYWSSTLSLTNFQLENFPLTAKFTRVIGISLNVFCVLEQEELYQETQLVLCNPSIRESITVLHPFPKMPPSSITGYGFGFCQEKNEFRVIALLQASTESNISEIEVYGTKSQSWSSLAMNIPYSMLKFYRCGTFAQETLFWVMGKKGETANDKKLLASWVIVGVHLTGKGLKLIQFPSLEGVEVVIPGLLELEGYLNCCYNQSDKMILWSYRDDNWIHNMTILYEHLPIGLSPGNEVIPMIFFNQDGARNLLLRVNEEDYFVLFNEEDNNYVLLNFPGNMNYMFNLGVSVTSIYSVKHGLFPDGSTFETEQENVERGGSSVSLAVVTEEENVERSGSSVSLGTVIEEENVERGGSSASLAVGTLTEEENVQRAVGTVIEEENVQRGGSSVSLAVVTVIEEENVQKSGSSVSLAVGTLTEEENVQRGGPAASRKSNRIRRYFTPWKCCGHQNKNQVNDDID